MPRHPRCRPNASKSCKLDLSIAGYLESLACQAWEAKRQRCTWHGYLSSTLVDSAVGVCAIGRQRAAAQLQVCEVRVQGFAENISTLLMDFQRWVAFWQTSASYQSQIFLHVFFENAVLPLHVVFMSLPTNRRRFPGDIIDVITVFSVARVDSRDFPNQICAFAACAKSTGAMVCTQRVATWNLTRRVIRPSSGKSYPVALVS